MTQKESRAEKIKKLSDLLKGKTTLSEVAGGVNLKGIIMFQQVKGKPECYRYIDYTSAHPMFPDPPKTLTKAVYTEQELKPYGNAGYCMITERTCHPASTTSEQRI